MPRSFATPFLLSMLICLACHAAGKEFSADAVVSLDGSGDFQTIQAAVMAAPYRAEGPPWIIRVQPGVYKERVYVQRERGNIRLVGSDASKCTLSGALHANMLGADGEPIGTFHTPTLQIDGDRFEVENLTIENTAGPVGQALAVRTDGDKIVFRNCRFLGWQDTALLNRGRVYVEDCYIEGHVDFIFGGATAWFERCHIHCLRDGYITAASTPPEQPYGFVFHKCRVTAEKDVQTYLGRPWRGYAMTVFLECNLAGGVRPEGWDNWRDPSREETVRYAEYRSTGLGANDAARVVWADQLNDRQANRFSVRSVLFGEDEWEPNVTSSKAEGE